MQLQALRGEFETLRMKSGESVSDYFSRTLAVANKMRIHGEKLEDVTIIEKILRSMTVKFNFITCSIEESNDIDELSIDELHSSLIVHERKLNVQDNEEQALQAAANSKGAARGKGNWRGNFEDAVKELKWQKAMDDEIAAIEKNNTWELTDLPKRQKTIGVKWVYKTKLKENGEVDKYKARLVAKGYKQEFGIDYKEVFAPVVRHDTIRLVIAMAAQNSWPIFQLDVKLAFLHGELQEQVFSDQPPGYVKFGYEHKVYKLRKALYGLKQAPRAWYMENPKELHLLAAKRIFRYLQGTTDFGLFYKRGEKSDLIGFTDSDYAGDLDDRKSTSGYIFMMGSGAVSWSSKKQAIVTLSTTEAEYVAATSCACQAIWLRKILEELYFKQEGPTLIFCDNSSAIKLSKNPVLHERSKHIDVRYHFLCNLVKDGAIDLTYCKSEDQVADIFTKPLKLAAYLKLRKLLGVCNWKSSI
ncbi:Retrovirus-related Pol polyprotein from transposon TNT 1-94 [Melia azedarach]|uniref:Retrovirus-related Pol polyprotein from transposon TNT 1-94 n=1 Tax=Melia azedarach TaxID=155640 RepID=A0ACC1Y5A5_MELAZ|nr:Retrovirus-related Pol polyprotein from transposon TNT 1-94 [Melia azedarach]